jgi:hypothetical protein
MIMTDTDEMLPIALTKQTTKFISAVQDSIQYSVVRYSVVHSTA